MRQKLNCVAYLRLVYQEKDDLAFERIVNNPKRSIGKVLLNQFTNILKKFIKSWDVIEKMINEDLIKPSKSRFKFISWFNW